MDDGDYTCVQLDEFGTPQFAELYDSGRLFHVDHWTSDLDGAREEHLARCPGIPFGIQLAVQETGNHRWSVSHRFSGSGARVGYLVRLERNDTYDAPLMTLHIDIGRQLTKIEKNFYDSDGQRHYVFEYDPRGDVQVVLDLPEGSTPRLATALGAVDVPGFYREGFALPAGIARSSIPLLDGQPQRRPAPGRHPQQGLS
ncbi:hypothetical protein OG785_01430 [Streptomyces sp. NBC_00006]|uniref:hypothetical protein n=1 Tax=Streptomyces sp. NBC_00006 TaxID=2975619 RepID=UPI0022556CC6|nr:hypothetical protein [Streptomyces sp. NBC_00006]MCX5529235.1 hypothetical protein [Streptomyces sp. NBC_00006]